MRRFAYDPAKSARNKREHHIDFEEAKALWLDLDRFEVPARTIDEPRFHIIGRIRQAVWTATVTYRHDENDETITRIISVRRAHDDEEAAYHNFE